MLPNLQKALAAVVADLSAMPEVDGILFFGSAQRGEARPQSDLDMYCVTHADEYWREGRVYEGVEVELFFNPASKMRERLDNRDDVAAHGFATGEVLLDRTGVMAELAALGRRIWAEGPAALTDWEVKTYRYRLGDRAKDMEDLPPGAPAARMAGGALVPAALEAYFPLHRLWGAKPYRAGERLRQLDPALWALVERFYGEGFPPAIASAIVDHVLAPFGGRILVYESDRVSV